jgi:hypothetical protein
MVPPLAFEYLVAICGLFFRVFGFVAKKTGSVHDNVCHIFAELGPEQPATAIVNFVTKVMMGQGKGSRS